MLPAAATLKKQGANNGATAAFLISTPESGVDSISITWALLDPIMTIARPVAAFLSAMVAGMSENLVNPPDRKQKVTIDLSCQVDQCCDGEECPSDVHSHHHGILIKIYKGMHHAAFSLWAELVGWFFIGIILAGFITVIIPDDFISQYLGGGFLSMILMLAIGIPIYICATASTPIAAAFILKGVSPGAALVFLLVGPATNVTSMSVLIGLLGKRATALYLVSISVVSVLCGLVVDAIYIAMAISPVAIVGQAQELIPFWLKFTGGIVLLALSIQPLYRIIRGFFAKDGDNCGCCEDHDDHLQGHQHIIPTHTISHMGHNKK